MLLPSQAQVQSNAVSKVVAWASRSSPLHRYQPRPIWRAPRLLWPHIGWMVLKPRRKPGVAGVSALARNPVVQFQHRWYIEMLLTIAFIAPTLIAGFGWGDFKGGFVYAGAARLVFVHHVCAKLRISQQNTYILHLTVYFLRKLARALARRDAFR